MKYTLIIKESDVKIFAYSNHIKIVNKNKINIFAYRHLRSIFINKMATISLISCIKICNKIDLYVIDHKGNVILEMRSIKDETI